MEQFDSKKFYPQGKVMLNSNHPRKTDAKLTKVEAAQLTQRANTVENLTKDFL